MKNAKKKKIDLAMIGAIFVVLFMLHGIGTAIDPIYRTSKSQNSRWEEELSFATGHKIKLSTASISGLQLIEGVGPTLANAIFTYRSNLLLSCVEGNLMDKRTEEIIALDKVPGIGVVRSKKILHSLTLCTS